MAAVYSTNLRRWVLSLPPVEWAVQRLRELLIGSLRCGPVPEHVAFVMDGNRRYARKRGVETVEGHNLGFEALSQVLEVCYKCGVRVVTIYAFSIENFKRSKWEVDALMDMAKTKLVQMSQHGALFDRYGASVRILGDRSLVRDDVLQQVDKAVAMTAHNERAVLNVCFPYTSREEITHAVRETVREFSTAERPSGRGKRGFSEGSIQRHIRTRQLSSVTEEDRPSFPAISGRDTSAEQASSETDTEPFSDPLLDTASAAGLPQSSQSSLSASPSLLPTQSSTKQLPDPETISAATLSSHMYTHPAPPLDLLIRTSGVQRLSDFMLWQCHEQTSVVFLDCLWPEFDLWTFLPVLVEWQWRQRKEEQNGVKMG